MHIKRTLLKSFVIVVILVTGQSLTQAAALRDFMEVGDLTSQPIGHYELCRRMPGECAAQPSNVQPENLSQSLLDRLKATTVEVNRAVKPVSDLDNYGSEEVWAYPEGRGDCEDYALEKKKRLSEAGLPPGNLLLTVVRKPDGEGHAVLTVRTDNGDFVRDNLDDRVRLWRAIDYEYLKRQDTKHAGRWVTIRVGLEPIVGAVD
ncbi:MULTISPECIES: transglutaminase-like cysteine peptidase [Hyphomicrobiales]|uniref:transglutaminase-like cysteine peptidase n=1 Tax=Hyphomicrobiales TaxID=356 RepID=UPI001CBD62F7|nr:transglutaminase-like cysteine peptidase [Oricola indica]